MTRYPVSISLSSFGADLVRQRGQASFIPLLVSAGASRIELREELFTNEDFPALALAIQVQGLECVYSSPLELWLPGQPLPNPELAATLQRAATCGAKWLKVSLGHFGDTSDVSALASLLLPSVRLLVENDQTLQGGRIDAFTRFFARIDALQLPVGMTFDIGNWQWQEQSAISAARQLGRHVQYLHCKAVARAESGKLVATPPAPTSLHLWEQLLKQMPVGVPRAVEYPLQGDDLLAITREHVALLARLGAANLPLEAKAAEVMNHV